MDQEAKEAERRRKHYKYDSVSSQMGSLDTNRFESHQQFTIMQESTFDDRHPNEELTQESQALKGSPSAMKSILSDKNNAASRDSTTMKAKAFFKAHACPIIFVKDGISVEGRKPQCLKIDLSSIVRKYLVPEPKNIYKMPRQYMKIQRNFLRRGYLDVLEICSKKLLNLTLEEQRKQEIVSKIKEVEDRASKE